MEYRFDDAITLKVPGDWNSQDDKLFYYESSVWYRRVFDAPANRAGKRYLLYFGGANYQADVYLNGRKLGTHIGGFTPFQYEVTDRLRETGNSLVVRVNNKRLREGVPTINTDWWNYGGITRSVRLIELPQTYLADYAVELKRGEGDRIRARVSLDGPDREQTLHIRIPELGVDQSVATGPDGSAETEFAVQGLVRWSPENPKLYDVTIASASDSSTERVGFRTIETKGRQLLLNGKPIFLRGIAIHGENPLRGGRAAVPEEGRMLLDWAKDLGCNYARLAHYPHSEFMARLADEMGILLWEETPVYWTIQWENPDTLANAKAQLTELVERDKNRASVIIWSVANETPISDARTHFLKTLVDAAHALDDSRLVSAALEVTEEPANSGHYVVRDPFGQNTDIVAFNEYIGWYRGGLPDACKDVTWEVAYDKPVLISEFGGGALAGKHGPQTARFTEEFQAWLYRETLPMLERIPGFSGCSPWILVDFRSPRRPLPGIQDGWNRKGLIGENGEFKQAFYVLRDYYLNKAGETPPTDPAPTQ
ncbi:MAG: glycoside hydrolase family 2 TIM barrel-domain containing protein [Opitutales bacterium]